MKTIMILLPLALVAGCETAPKSAQPLATTPPILAPVSGTELDQKNTEKIRVGETLKAYPLGRVIDPADPNVMHEAHVAYRREAEASWDLEPNAPTVVPLGPVLAVADPAQHPGPLPTELEHKVAEQNQLMASLIEQNEALVTQLAKLNKEMGEIKANAFEKILEGGK